MKKIPIIIIVLLIAVACKSSLQKIESSHTKKESYSQQERSVVWKNIERNASNSVLVFSDTDQKKNNNIPDAKKQGEEGQKQTTDTSPNTSKRNRHEPVVYSGNSLVREKKYFDLSGQQEIFITITGNAKIQFRNNIFSGQKLTIVGQDAQYVVAERAFEVYDTQSKIALKAAGGIYQKKLDLLTIEKSPQLVFERKHQQKSIKTTLQCQKIFRLMSAALNYCPGSMTLYDEQMRVSGEELIFSDQQQWLLVQKNIFGRYERHFWQSQSLLWNLKQNSWVLEGQLKLALYNNSGENLSIDNNTSDKTLEEHIRKNNQDYFLQSDDYVLIQAAHALLTSHEKSKISAYLSANTYFSLKLPVFISEFAKQAFTLLGQDDDLSETYEAFIEKLKITDFQHLIAINKAPAYRDVLGINQKISFRSEFVKVLPDENIHLYGHVLALSQEQNLIVSSSFLQSHRLQDSLSTPADFQGSNAFADYCLTLLRSECLIDFQQDVKKKEVPAQKEEYLASSKVQIFQWKKTSASYFISLSLESNAFEFRRKDKLIDVFGDVVVKQYLENKPAKTSQVESLFSFFVGTSIDQLNSLVLQQSEELKLYANNIRYREAERELTFLGQALLLRQGSALELYNANYSLDAKQGSFEGLLSGQLKP